MAQVASPKIVEAILDHFARQYKSAEPIHVGDQLSLCRALPRAARNWAYIVEKFLLELDPFTEGSGTQDALVRCRVGRKAAV